MAPEKLLGGDVERLFCWVKGGGEVFGPAGGGAVGLGKRGVGE